MDRNKLITKLQNLTKSGCRPRTSPGLVIVENIGLFCCFRQKNCLLRDSNPSPLFDIESSEHASALGYSAPNRSIRRHHSSASLTVTLPFVSLSFVPSTFTDVGETVVEPFAEPVSGLMLSLRRCSAVETEMFCWSRENQPSFSQAVLLFRITLDRLKLKLKRMARAKLLFVFHLGEEDDQE